MKITILFKGIKDKIVGDVERYKVRGNCLILDDGNKNECYPLCNIICFYEGVD